MRPGVGVGDRLGEGVGEGEGVGDAVSGCDGVGPTVATGAHALTMTSARTSFLIELPYRRLSRRR
jgi:hypothetical protein